MVLHHTFLSIVMPCLNEEQTIGICIQKAQKGLTQLKKYRIDGEIIVVDNGSVDQSVSIAKKLKARVVTESRRGYGNAYLRGIAKAKGNYILIGDSDGTYDFSRIYPFVQKLATGSDVVLGSRFKGSMKRNAMPFLNRYLGNPFLTGMLNIFYSVRISDAHTGMRAFTKQAFLTMNLKSPGMEFASEMIIKAVYHKLKIVEIPISYSPRLGKSKLSPISDALRHIRFMLLYAPTYALFIPGAFLTILGGSLSILLRTTSRSFFQLGLDVHTMTIGVLITLLGIQIIILGIFSRKYAYTILGLPGGPLGTFMQKHITATRMFIIGLVVLLLGLLPISTITFEWILHGFGPLARMREFIFNTGIAIIGTEFIFSSLVLGLFEEQR